MVFMNEHFHWNPTSKKKKKGSHEGKSSSTHFCFFFVFYVVPWFSNFYGNCLGVTFSHKKLPQCSIPKWEKNPVGNCFDFGLIFVALSLGPCIRLKWQFTLNHLCLQPIVHEGEYHPSPVVHPSVGVIHSNLPYLNHHHLPNWFKTITMST